LKRKDAPDVKFRFPAFVIAFLTFLALNGALVSSCGDDDDAGDSGATLAAATARPTSKATAGKPTGDIRVFAAASLTDSFEEVRTAFETENAGVSITYNFAGSPALRTQLQEGAEADVYASADTSNMQQALDADLVVDDAEVFTRNRLVVIVPADNPASVNTLQDLSKDGLRLVLAAEDVPIGRYARESIAKMQAEGSFGETFEQDTLANIASNEPNVKAVVTKVQLGEADAGIVYVTDVTTDVEGDITSLDIPDNLNVIAVYPIAVTADAANAEAAQAFIDFLLSADGQAILAEFGFQPVE
jgi:molybdate transport system substrate-binding protein